MGAVLFRFLLLSIMVNCLSSPSMRAASFLDQERWRVGAVLSMNSTGGSPGIVRVGRVVVLFVGLGPGFVCCWGELLGRLI